MDAGQRGPKGSREAQGEGAFILCLCFFVTSTTDCFVSDDIFTETELAHCSLECLSKWKKKKKKKLTHRSLETLIS